MEQLFAFVTKKAENFIESFTLLGRLFPCLSVIFSGDRPDCRHVRRRNRAGHNLREILRPVVSWTANNPLVQSDFGLVSKKKPEPPKPKQIVVRTSGKFFFLSQCPICPDFRCGHCKRLAPMWEDLGKHFAENKNINIAKVDCTTDRSVCSDHGVCVLSFSGDFWEKHLLSSGCLSPTNRMTPFSLDTSAKHESNWSRQRTSLSETTCTATM